MAADVVVQHAFAIGVLEEAAVIPHSHCSRARAWTHAEPRARTYDHARDRTSARVDVRRRMSLHLHAIVKYYVNYADTA